MRITTPIDPKLAEEIHSQKDSKLTQSIAREEVHFVPGELVSKDSYLYPQWKLGRGTMGTGFATLHARVIDEATIRQMASLKNLILPFTSRRHNILLLERQSKRLRGGIAEYQDHLRLIGSINKMKRQIYNELHRTLPVYNDTDLKKIWEEHIPEDDRTPYFPFGIAALKWLGPRWNTEKNELMPVSEESKNIFKHEFALQSELQHENIPSTIGNFIETEKKGIGYLTNYVDGMSLENLLREEKLAKDDETKDETIWWRKDGEKYISPSIALSMIYQLLNGFSYLQKKNFHHGDIQRGNMIVGADGFVNITDFGLAEELKDGERLTRVGGDAKYFSPEVMSELTAKEEGGYQLKDHEKGITFNSKSTVYSLGGLSAAIMLGEHPFIGHTFEEIQKKIISGKIDDIRKVNPLYTKEEKEILDRMLVLNPDKRSSLDEMLNRVGDALRKREGNKPATAILKEFMQGYDEDRRRGFSYQEKEVKKSFGSDEDE